MSEDEETAPKDDFFIVGIGASAGGLEALQQLVRHISFDSLAFIVVQHMAPTHESKLTQLLAKNTSIESQPSSMACASSPTTSTRCQRGTIWQFCTG